MTEHLERRVRFFDLSLDLLCIVDADGVFVDVSPSWTGSLGWTADELVGRRYMDLVHPDDAERTIAVAGALQQGERTTSFENRYRTKAGDYRSMQWASLFERETGMFYAVVKDVTERRQVEEYERALQEAERRRHEALEINDSIVQGLAVAINALQERRPELATEALERTLTAARALVDELMRDVPVEPGSFVRSKPATVVES